MPSSGFPAATTRFRSCARTRVRVEVRSGEEIELDLADYVIAASGRPVAITDEASVRATHSDGSSLVVDDDTLRFRSEDGYFGPASLSFTVTDGSGPDDPEARTGTIVIPIDVLSTENQPPSFIGGVLDLEPGQSRTVDLVKLTRYPYPDAADELEYRVLPPPADGFEVSLDGDEMTITAAEGTRTGTRGAVTVGVADSTRRRRQWPDRRAGRAVDEADRPPRRRCRRRDPRVHDLDRRARQRRGHQPVPRDSAASRR